MKSPEVLASEKILVDKDRIINAGEHIAKIVVGEAMLEEAVEMEELSISTLLNLSDDEYETYKRQEDEVFDDDPMKLVSDYDKILSFASCAHLLAVDEVESANGFRLNMVSSDQIVLHNLTVPISDNSPNLIGKTISVELGSGVTPLNIIQENMLAKNTEEGTSYHDTYFKVSVAPDLSIAAIGEYVGNYACRIEELAGLEPDELREKFPHP